MRSRWLAAVALSIACGSEDPPIPPGTGGSGGEPPEAFGCEPGTIETDAGCESAGVPALGCAPGSWQDDRGGCHEAGIEPDRCAAGFEPDGAQGCEPILPDTDCPSGEVAWIGETSCHPVGDCGTTRWGAIPRDAQTQHVDGAYLGGDSDGSEQKPWTSVQAGIDAALPGAVVALAAGNYANATIAGDAVKLWGRCPSMVELSADGTDVVHIDSADGTEVHGLALTGNANWAGIGLNDSEDVLIEDVRVHDTAGHRGLDLTGNESPSTVTVRRVLVERVSRYGVMVWGAQVLFEDLVVRDTTGDGRGLVVSVNQATGIQGGALLRRGIVERCRDFGVLVGDADFTMEASVVRDIDADLDGQDGLGVYAQDPMFGTRTTSLSVTGSLVTRTRGYGIAATSKGSMTVSDTVVRDIEPGDDDNGFGIAYYPLGAGTLALQRVVVEKTRGAGIVLVAGAGEVEGALVRDTTANTLGLLGLGLIAVEDQGVRATLTARGSMIEDSSGGGVVVSGSDGTLDGLWIRSTETTPGVAGYGLVAELLSTPAAVTATGCLIEKSRTAGVYVTDSELALERSTVAHTAPSSPGADAGYGVWVNSGPPDEPVSFRASGVLIDDSYEAGLKIQGAGAELSGIIVRATHARASDGLFGDGVLALSDGEAAVLSIERSSIESAERAGVASFGAQLELASCALECNPIHLNGETLEGLGFSFTDGGGNRCGCEGAGVECKVLSSALEPPVQSVEGSPFAGSFEPPPSPL